MELEDSQDLELILDKLYELYDNNIYPILPILEGNGIILKKQREEFEYVKLLENFGYIISNNIARQADAQLTVNGKIYVENKLKQSKPNYESICDDKEIYPDPLKEVFIFNAATNSLTTTIHYDQSRKPRIFKQTN